MTKTTTPHRDNYEAVTNRIIESLEKGVIPWHKPWASGYYNARTGRRYRGLNVPILALAGFTDPRFLTFKQAQAMGGNVRKGEKGHCVMFWKLMKKEQEGQEGQDPTLKVFPVIKTFTVFNVSQCEGLTLPPVVEFTHQPIDEAENLVSNMPQAPAINHGGERAYYSPSADYVQMPTPESFESPLAYYSTLFHELTHSTGHASRVGRFKPEDHHKFGSEPYAKEELIAELGSAFLRSACGIEAAPELENSAAYIQSWLNALKNDRKLIVFAAAAAQKAADFIINEKAEESAEEGEEVA